MNAFNRFIMLIIALLLIAVPVLLLLVALGVLSAELIDRYTNYSGAVNALNGLSPSSLGAAGIIIGIIGLIVVLIAGAFLLRELTFGRRVARSTTIDETPGQETTITAKAVKTLAEGAAREVGAVSPSVSLTSKKRPYLVECRIQVPPSSNFTQLATEARENIRQVLEGQSVPVKDVEVTVQGTAA